MSIEKNTKNTLSHEEGGFTTVLNDTLNQIKNMDALGVYCYLASKPPGWTICKLHLQNHFGCGRDKVNSVFKYLKNIGAIEVTMLRDEKGLSTGWDTKLKRKIPINKLTLIQNTENPYSGHNIVNNNTDCTPPSRILKNHILVKPHSGKSAPINKRGFKKESIVNKTNNKPTPVFVFSDDQAIMAFLLALIATRGLSIPEEIVDQVMFYVGAERNQGIVAKKINIALKRIKEKKWNTPNGYMGITCASIRAKEEEYEKNKKEQIKQDAQAFKAVTNTIAQGKGFQEFRMMAQMLGSNLNANTRTMQEHAV